MQFVAFHTLPSHLQENWLASPPDRHTRSTKFHSLVHLGTLGNSFSKVPGEGTAAAQSGGSFCWNHFHGKTHLPAV